MHKQIAKMDIVLGWIGFARTCILFLLAHFLDLVTFQNIAYLATACSGFYNVYSLWKKNRKK